MINNTQKSEFFIKYKFSSAEPLNPSSETLSAHAFTMAVRDFLLEHFRGLIDIDVNIEHTENINVSLEYAALFLKTIICYVHGCRIINISIESKKDSLEMLIDCGADLVFEENNLRDIIRAVRNSGMYIYLNEHKFLIVAPYVGTPSYRMYAQNPRDGYMRMLYSLGEIFFSGPPMEEDE